jgi:hypothetical protein
MKGPDPFTLFSKMEKNQTYFRVEPQMTLHIIKKDEEVISNSDSSVPGTKLPISYFQYRNKKMEFWIKI